MSKSLGKSSTGLESNVAASLSYLAGFITGILFFVLEKDNKFVKFHAMQSIITFAAFFILQIVLVYTRFLAFLYPIVQLASLVVWILLMVKAYQGHMFKLPFIGELAEEKSK